MEFQAYPLDVSVSTSYDESSSAPPKPKNREDDNTGNDCGEITMCKGAGGISFKIPGKITHKTTIRIAHFPQPGCKLDTGGPYDAEELEIRENHGIPANCCPDPCAKPTPCCEPQPAPCNPPTGNCPSTFNCYNTLDPAAYQRLQQQFQMFQCQQLQQAQVYQNQGMFNPYCGNGNYGGNFRP